MLKLCVKKLDSTAKLPEKNRETDEGYDIFSLNDYVLINNSVQKINTGIIAYIESDDVKYDDFGRTIEKNDYWLQVEGRSGMASKGVFPIGGIVDLSYRGEIIVILANLSSSLYMIKKEDKIAQLVIRKHNNAEVSEISEISETDRGNKGFGSSGF